MATSGYKDVVVTSWDTLRFRWWVNSQSITNNSSTIGWALELIATSDGRISATSTQAWKVTVNGTEYSGSSNVGISNNTTKTLASGTTTIAHNSDGTKSFSYSFEQYFGITFSGVWITTKSGSGTGTLDTIARASVPTVSAASVDMGTEITIYTNRKNDALTHDLAYSFAGGSYVSIATGVATSYKWKTPNLSSSIPNAASGTLTIRCTTKNGSTTVGSATVAVTLSVPSTSGPTISAVSVTEAVAGIAAQFGAFVQDQSKLTVSITAAGSDGSTISKYNTVAAGFTYKDKTFTTNTLQYAGDKEVVVTVTDSRGRSASKTVPITILAYTTPATTTFKVYRCDASGNAKNDGTYLGVNYAYSVSSLGGKNTARMVIDYKIETGSTWTTLMTSTALEGSATRVFSSPTFSTDYQYDIRLTVTDWFGASTSYTVTLPTADVVLDISRDGKALAFGKVAQTQSGIEFARNMYDKFDTLIGNGLAVYTGSGDAAIDPDTTLNHLIVTDKNTPTATFWYVMTNFYSTKSATANRMQIAVPYVTAYSDIYYRVYYGSWSEWTRQAVLWDEYDVGTKHVRIWANRWAEVTDIVTLSNVDCSTAMGAWYRSVALGPYNIGLEFKDPVITANFESTTQGALLWVTKESTSTQTPTYYLVRPTSSTIASGKIKFRVTGYLA